VGRFFNCTVPLSAAVKVSVASRPREIDPFSPMRRHSWSGASSEMS
jgi:hypothetical protein